jgi:hypothetical protein
MKYKTVQIRPTLKNIWEVVFLKTDGTERMGTSIPNALGFYHYPETLSDKKAGEKLRKKMIDIHKEEISKLQKSLKQLESLEIL